MVQGLGGKCAVSGDRSEGPADRIAERGGVGGLARVSGGARGGPALPAEETGIRFHVEIRAPLRGRGNAGGGAGGERPRAAGRTGGRISRGPAGGPTSQGIHRRQRIFVPFRG